MRNLLFSTSLLLSLTVPAQRSIAGLVKFEHPTPATAPDVYKKPKAAGSGILNWAPEFAVISASGDMGITTAHYQIKAAVTDSVPSHGNFSSVWQVNKEGLRKNMADLGTSYQATPQEVKEIQQVILPVSQSEGSTYEELLAMDQALNSIIHKKNTVALATYFPEDSRLNRDNYAPVSGTEAVVARTW